MQCTLYPLHIHGFFLSSYGSHTFTDPYDIATFTTDLRVVTSYYELFTVYYRLLRSIYGKKSTICYEVSRITTSNLQAFYEFLWIVTSILRNVTIHRSFYVLVTICLRVVMNSYELVTSIYESLRYFAKNYINFSSSCSCTIVQNITSGDRRDYAAQF